MVAYNKVTEVITGQSHEGNLHRTVSTEQRIRNPTETEGLESSLECIGKKMGDGEAKSEYRQLF